jgi:hypothetical protein
MKPFNLEAALRGEKVVDNTGSVAVDFKVWEKADCIVFLFKRNDGHLYFMTYSIDSSYNGLFMAPTKKKGWINIYKDEIDKIYETGNEEQIFKTKEDAIERSQKCVWIRTIEIEWEE